MDVIPTRKPRFLVRLRRTVRRLGFLALLLAAALVALKYWGYDKLDDEVRSRVEERLRQQFPRLVVKVRSARRVQGKGIEVRGIRLSEAVEGKLRELVYIDEVMADCDTHFPDFVTRMPDFRLVRMRGLKLRVERHRDGTWSLAQLASVAQTGELVCPPVAIENGELEIVDPQRGLISLRQIRLTLTPQLPAPGSSSRGGTPWLAFRGSLAGDHLDKMELHGILDPASRQWELKGAVEGLEFNPRLRAALPREVGQALDPLASIRGRTHFGFRVTSRLPKGAPRGAAPELDFEVDGQISEGSVDDARLPERMTDLVAKVHCDNQSLRIDDLSARCGQTIIESLSLELHGFSPGSPVTLALDARQVDLHRLRKDAFPAGMREVWSRFSPQGTINLVGTMHYDGRQWHPDLTAECLDLSVRYDRFPYRVTDGVGTIKLHFDHLTADVRFLAGSQTVRCTCDVRHPGKQFTGWIDLKSGGPLLIDDNLLAALEPRHRQLVNAFHPRGRITFGARFFRDRAEDIVHRQMRIDLKELSVAYDKFRYPIDRVTGALHARDDEWTFQDLAGYNDSAQIAGSGKWLARPDRDGNQLHLTFHALSVPLDEELQLALAPAAQRLWSNVRPRGTLDEVHVHLRYSPASGNLAVNVDAAKRNGSRSIPVSIEPTWFRYKLDEVTGDFAYDSQSGAATLTKVRARHEKTVVQTDGACRIQPDGSCSLRLTNLTADRLRPDHELLAALPGGVGQGLARLQLAGGFNMQGEVGIAVGTRDETPILDWNLWFDVENGSLQAGLPIEHVHGRVQLFGRSDGRSVFSRGELEVDSAMVRGVQLTGVQGPLRIDSQRLLAGTMAERDLQGRVPRWVVAQVAGGELSLDGELEFESGKFLLSASLEDGDLSQVVEQFSPSQRKLTGNVFGIVSLGGTTEGVHTWRGEGQVRLLEADIYELPVMVSLLKLLSIQRPDRTAFTKSVMDFRIEGDDVEFTQIDFEGDAITLKGRGWMNNRQEIDLKFYTQLGRDEMQLRIFRPVLTELNRQLLLIEVSGPLEHPRVTKQPLPAWNEQLAQLFPELAARAERERPGVQPRGVEMSPRRLLQPGGLWPGKE